MTTLAAPVSTQPGTQLAAFDRVRLLQLIEDALRSTPHCACGAPMTVEAEGDALWLACPSFTAPDAGRLAWLRSGIRSVLHERQLIEREIPRAA